MINNVVLVGRLTRDPEVRKTTSGLSVCQFTVACDRIRKKDSTEQQQADFINCVAWRGSADFLGSYARKGYLVGVEGRIQTRNYDDRDGKRVYVTEVVCDSVQLLESKKKDQEQQSSSSQPQSYASNDLPMSNEPSQSVRDARNETYDNNLFNGGYEQQQYERDADGNIVINSDDLPF